MDVVSRIVRVDHGGSGNRHIAAAGDRATIRLNLAVVGPTQIGSRAAGIDGERTG